MSAVTGTGAVDLCSAPVSMTACSYVLARC